jgi:O-antigen/teichoic acid export membrane protein
MGNATNRYIATAIAKGDEYEKKYIFSTCLIVHSIIAIIIIVLCEVAGFWLFSTKMEIPADRMTACMWVLQFSIATCALGVFCVPYDAVIIAHEKMSAFAFINALTSTFNLVIAFALMYYHHDKLILYAALLFFIQVVKRFIYSGYCQRHFHESKFARIVDWKQIKEMFIFAFWNLFGNMAAIVCNPVLNIFLNIFFGPIVNAARGIAVQVQSVVSNFISNFQLAVIPQITKNYAIGNNKRVNQLIIESSKLSYFMFLIIALPIVIEARYILTLWLGNIPDHTISFMRFSLIIMLISSWIQPLHTANLATAKIKKFQTVRGLIMLLMIPLSYVALICGGSPEIVFVMQLVTTFVAQIAMLIIIRPLIGLSLKTYTIEVFLKPAIVTILAAIMPIYLHLYLDEGLLSTFLVMATCLISVIISIYFAGLNSIEKTILKSKMKPVLDKITKIA